MTLQHNNGFGRRVPARPSPGSRSLATPGSPLVKQLGGILLGVAIAFGLGVAFVQLMKQAGRTLDRKFVEAATPGSPEDAIRQVKNVDGDLRHVQETCTQQAKNATLT